MPKSYHLDLVSAKVIPSDRYWVPGIDLVDGKTRPFIVERSWSGPAGTYGEQWLFEREGTHVYQSKYRHIRVRGMQAVTDFRDSVTQPLELQPGTYQLNLFVEGIRMGQIDFEVRDLSEAAA